jgi:hypothetical protein
MGKVIEGPWTRQGLPEIMSQLDRGLPRMIAMLERVREDYTRGTVPLRPAQLHHGTGDPGGAQLGGGVEN